MAAVFCYGRITGKSDLTAELSKRFPGVEVVFRSPGVPDVSSARSAQVLVGFELAGSGVEATRPRSVGARLRTSTPTLAALDVLC